MAICNKDSDTKASNGSLGCVVVGEADGSLLAVGYRALPCLVLLSRCGGACLLRYDLTEFDVNVAETLDKAIVYEGSIVVIQFEAQCSDKVQIV